MHRRRPPPRPDAAPPGRPRRDLPAVAVLLVGPAAVALLGAPTGLAGQVPAPSPDSSRPAPASLRDTVPVRAVVLPDLRVRVEPEVRRGKLRGFDRRRRRHPAGRFIGRREIEERDPRRLTDLLVGVPGLRMDRPAAGRRSVRAGRRARPPGRPSCRVRYFVDGVHLPEASRFALDELAPEDVAGIEIYRGPSEVPTRFSRRRDACGVIVVWTRDPGEEEPARP